MTKKSPFAERLARLMAEREMSQSDLAREIWGTMTDERGYEVARNRQTLGKYLHGTVEPRIGTKRKMAEVFGIPLSELDPQSDPLTRRGSGIRMDEVDNRDARLEVNLVVPKNVAQAAVKLLLPYTK